MSIYKEEHVEDFDLWKWIRGIFGAKCNSFVKLSGPSPHKVTCELSLGHHCRHKKGASSWAYGDNWLGQSDRYMILQECHTQLQSYHHQLRAENSSKVLEVTNLLNDIRVQLDQERAKWK